MPSSRVIRPTRVLSEAFRVVVPEGAIGGRVCRGGVGEAGELSCEERGRELAEALTRMEERWEEREQEHAEQLRRVQMEAEEAARERIEEAVSKFTSVVDDFLAQREDLLKSSEESIVRLAVAIARRIVGDGIAVNQEAVLETVRRALKQIVEKEHVVIRVNPADLKIVREHASEWLGIVEGTRALEIEEDERIRRGGCLVETESGNVEAQIDKQLQTLEKALVEGVR
jgi:flagellar assembly protein FliH